MTLTPKQQAQAIEILQIVERGLDSLNVTGEKNNWTIGSLSFMVDDFLDTVAETEAVAQAGGEIDAMLEDIRGWFIALLDKEKEL